MASKNQCKRFHPPKISSLVQMQAIKQETVFCCRGHLMLQQGVFLKQKSRGATISQIYQN